MKETDDILRNTSHRPWELPIEQWAYYQEWNNALFLHWKVSEKDLIELIPKGVLVDTIAGDAWISIVAFTMEKIKPKRLPSISTVSDFHEINVRTYVTRDNKPGVYFLNIEAEKQLSAWTARVLSGLPYEKASINRKQEANKQTYSSENKTKGFSLDTSFIVEENIEDKTELDKWLTERYCLYHEVNTQLYRYEIHHKEWKLNSVKLLDLKTDYTIDNLSLDRQPTLIHYSDGVKVIAWKRKYLGISGTGS